MDKKFEYPLKLKIVFVAMIAIGIIAAILSFVLYHDHGTRFWANLLLNNVYFIMIAMSGIVFIAIHALGNSGWQALIQRVPEAMSMALPINAAFMLVILVGLWLGGHHLYHWAHVTHHDPILEMKEAYLNIPFFSIRTIVYLIGWMFFVYRIRRLSIKQDISENPVELHKKILTTSAIFIVFFAITSSTSAWDWLMSLDPHWFSTLYGWYVFSGLLASGTAMMMLLTLYLKHKGYIPQINKEHIHDLGKYLFAFSVLWTYLWFSQFMLIWYGNIPEETIYFVQRFENYRNLFFLNLIINFGLPFLVLMTRNSKRISWIAASAAVLVLVGHYIDFYLMVMPGATGNKITNIGIVEIGMSIGFLGAFLFLVFRSLGKAALVPKKHPYLQESLEFHTQY